MLLRLMKKILLISNPQFTGIKLGDQPRNFEHWITSNRLVSCVKKQVEF